jgi:hypothetical protein
MKASEILNIFQWIPRIVCMLAILFFGLFAADVFGSDEPFWRTILALLVHLIPNFIMIFVLVISWKRELIAAIVFFLLFIIYAIWAHNHLQWILIMGGILIAIAILYLVSWILRQKARKEMESGNEVAE